MKGSLRGAVETFPPARAVVKLRRRLLDWRSQRIVGKPMMDRDQLLKFWQQPEPEGNVPDSYIGATHRSEMLLEQLGPLPFGSRILEVGCNVGRNLAYLKDRGYPNVEGVEISPHAVALLRKTYPQLADADIHVGAAETVLPSLSPYDLVFTMAVLEHIHPDSVDVFDEIARLGRAVVAVEPSPNSPHDTSRQHPHDLEAEFTHRGLRLVSIAELRDNPLVPDLGDYAVWRFEAHPGTDEEIPPSLSSKPVS